MSSPTTPTLSPLEKQLEQASSPEERLVLLNDLAWHIRQQDIPRSRVLADEALLLAESEKNLLQKGRALRALGNAEDLSNQPQQALLYLRQAAEIFTQLDDTDQLIGTNNLIGKTLMYLGDLPGALAVFQENERIAQRIRNEQHQADALLTQGAVHLRNKEYRRAEKMLRESLAVCRRIGFAAGEGRALQNLSAIYIEEKNFEEGLRTANEAWPIFERLDENVSIANCLSNAATALLGLNRLEEAEALFMRTREMRLANKEQLHLVNNYISTAALYLLQKRFEDAKRDLDAGLEMAAAVHNVFQLTHLHKSYCELYEAQGLYREALEHFKKFHAYEEEVSSNERQRELRNLQVRAEVDKLENEKELYRKHTLVLEEANRQISTQKELIEEKNKDITDSIHYARRIQEALLPSDEELQRQLPGCFVFYRPKDIVSGDFYWLEEKSGLILFAVADCTGHGVPGALMSMIGHNLLHQVAGELSDLQPGNILSQLDHGLRNTLKQHSADSGNNDGMDILLCVIDRAKRQLRFSGSRRPLWLFRNGEATEFKGERTYVGGKGEGFREFTTHTLDCREGDWLYLFSDGFADQFGGPEQKKYQTGRFRNFLSGITNKSGATQQRLLENEFLQWKGDAEQLDDILVAGIPF